MEKFLLRARVHEWNQPIGDWTRRWAEGYLNLCGFVNDKPKFGFTEMVKGQCIYSFHNKNEDTTAYEAVEHSYFDRDTVSRWTGILDKNGKKIFEGDIVKTKYGRLCIVEWFSSPNYSGWDLTPVNTIGNIMHTKSPDSYDIWKPKYLEVLANIWDNKGLLGAGGGC